MEEILITGCAGFIGFHVAKSLLKAGSYVIGLDNLNDYYDVTLKEARLNLLRQHHNFDFVYSALEDKPALERIFHRSSISTVINLAAQAGVRYSLSNPRAYIDSNIVGFLNILEICRCFKVGHLIYASSSSVYGANTQMPFTVHHNVDHPVSLYAATKKSNELMAHVYSHLYGLPTTGLRFFTVYGPWGRPDMALFIFTRAILAGETIKVFNQGKMKRDFTYIDDIVESIVRLIPLKPRPNPCWSGLSPDPGTSYAPYIIYNIGSDNPVELDEFISILEQELGTKAKKQLLPMQPGDVPATWADVADLAKDVGYKPVVSIKKGIANFVRWYKQYYEAGITLG